MLINADDFYPISDYIDGTRKVQISGGKLTIQLDELKPATLESFSTYGGITTTPSDAKYMRIDRFVDNDENYILMLEEGDFWGHLMYVDKDVTLTGEMNTLVYNNVMLKKGWNFLKVKFVAPDNVVTASQTQPADLSWRLYDYF